MLVEGEGRERDQPSLGLFRLRDLNNPPMMMLIGGRKSFPALIDDSVTDFPLSRWYKRPFGASFDRQRRKETNTDLE